jgi:hypothetical protein
MVRKGSHLTEECKRMISEHHADVSGKNNPMYGVTHPIDIIIKIRESSKKTIELKHLTSEWLNIICTECGNHYHKSPYHINNTNFCSHKCYSDYRSKKLKESNNPNWRGGKSKEPYGFDFTKELKEYIKKKDNYECQMCFNNKNLVVHHLDYNKKNNKEDNLITLCKYCHGKTNGHRDVFKRLLTIKEFSWMRCKYDSNSCR